MKKEEEGMVIEVNGCMAKIKVGRHSECKNCGSCPGDSAMIVDAQNSIDALPGQRVAFEIKELNMLKAAFIVYILPLIAIFIGAVGGDLFAERTGYSIQGFEVLGGVVAFILAVVYIKFFDKSANNSNKMLPVITRSLN